MQLVQATMSGYSFFIALFMDQDGVEVAKTRPKKTRPISSISIKQGQYTYLTTRPRADHNVCDWLDNGENTMEHIYKE